jgi:hypothetical protein
MRRRERAVTDLPKLVERPSFRDKNPGKSGAYGRLVLSYGQLESRADHESVATTAAATRFVVTRSLTTRTREIKKVEPRFSFPFALAARINMRDTLAKARGAPV